MKTHVDLLIDHGTILTMDTTRRIITDGCIAIHHDKIVAVDTSEAMHAQYTGTTIINAQQHAVLPGFINGHAHGAMSLLRGIADDQSVLTWLSDSILPIEKQVISPEFVRTGTELALLEMIQSGITTVVDMYYDESIVAQTCADYGMRALVGYNIADQDEQLIAAGDFVATWKHHHLIRPAVAPHSLYAVPEHLLTAARDLAAATNVPLMIHFAESPHEATIIQEKYGLTPYQFLERTQLLNEHLILAHGVHIHEDEMRHMATYQIGVIHCPTSNMKLASGIAPVVALRQHNIPVGLGSDSAASNNVLNMFAEMKTATLLQRIAQKSAHACTAQQALELATIIGAQAIHAEQYMGSIEVGKYADIITIALDGIHQLPNYDIASTIVYASYPTDVRTVIIHGTIKMQDGKLLYPDKQVRKLKQDVEGFRAQVIQYCQKNSR